MVDYIIVYMVVYSIDKGPIYTITQILVECRLCLEGRCKGKK